MAEMYFFKTEFSDKYFAETSALRKEERNKQIRKAQRLVES
jgi:hypothetical protein